MRFHMGRPTADQISLRVEQDKSVVAITRSGHIIARFYTNESGLATEAQQNAQLFTDALSVYHETLSTPSEIDEELKRFKKKVDKLQEEISDLNKISDNVEDEVRFR